FIDNLMRPSDHSRDNGYGEMASAPQATLEQFHQMLLQNPAQDPRNVAEAVARLVALPKGQRPFRTVVDNIGMGAGVEPYNQHAEQLTRAIYGSMQMTHLLDVQP
ncbi:MAG: hypothetical protein KC609_11615, partial [Myxococcales bacterium]|nr:hypothetical protein [Myxococcales bacterium]